MFVAGTYFSSEEEYATYKANEGLSSESVVDAIEEALEFLRKAYRAESRSEAQSMIVEASAFLTQVRKDALVFVD